MEFLLSRCVCQTNVLSAIIGQLKSHCKAVVYTNLYRLITCILDYQAVQRLPNLILIRNDAVSICASNP